MAPYNFSKHYEDFLDGNQPSVITREYVELPLIGNAADAAAVKWGAAYHEGSSILKPNDLVTWSRDPQNFGKLIKFDEAKHSLADIIGQVGEVEDDQEPFGWLKWAMWDEAAKDTDLDEGPANKSGYSAPGDGGYPFDPEYKKFGNKYTTAAGYLNQYTTEDHATGVPGLLDGKNKAQTVQTREFNTGVVEVDNSILQLALGFKNIIEGTVKVYVGGIETSNFAVDYGRGVVALTVGTADANKDVVVNFRAEFFGTPAGWDYKGAVGVARILLKM
jgi:hypothetical protein